MLDIRIVMGVVVVLFAFAAFFSEGDHSINIIEKLDNATAPAEDVVVDEENSDG